MLLELGVIHRIQVIYKLSTKKSNNINQLTKVNEDIFYNVEFGEVEEVTYESVDGKRYKAGL